MARPTTRILITWGLLLFALVLLAGQLTSLASNQPFGYVGSNDFIEYWAAGRLFLSGGNPYDPASLLAIERTAGWPKAEPLMMWNPPWTLLVVMPYAVLPFHLGVVAWLLTNLAMLTASALALWQVMAGGIPTSWRRWGWLSAFLFVPALFTLRMGQISLWLLAGVAGFLWLARKRRDGLAGAVLALTTIKLHVLHLFLAVIVIWVVQRKRWRIALGLGVTMLAASAALWLLWPNWLTAYLAAAKTPPVFWATPTAGSLLRLLLGTDRGWLQYAPAVAGLSLSMIAIWQRGLDADPARWAAPILLASVLTAPFGWSWDLVVVMPAYLLIVAWLSTCPPRSLRRWASLAVLSIIGAGMVVLNLLRVNDFWFLWVAPALGLTYLLPRCPRIGYESHG